MEENTNGSIQKVMEYDGSMDTFSFFVGPYRNLNEIPEETQGMTQYGLNIEEALEAYYSMEEKDSYHTRENIIGIDYITGMSRPGQMQGMNVHQYLVRNRTMNRAAFMWIRDSAPALYDYLSKNFIPAIFNYSLDSQEEEVRITDEVHLVGALLVEVEEAVGERIGDKRRDAEGDKSGAGPVDYAARAPREAEIVDDEPSPHDDEHRKGEEEEHGVDIPGAAPSEAREDPPCRVRDIVREDAEKKTPVSPAVRG